IGFDHESKNMIHDIIMVSLAEAARSID
ncbi:phage virion morphogenesis protein, partial [Salmonella enterica]|nr:phage virion morphogenesis protein [Salmonella enterica]